MRKIRGVDLSHWNGQVNFQLLAKNGIEFVMLKMGGEEGTPHKYTIDPKFISYYEGAKVAGINVGAYMFANDDLKRCDPKENVKYYMDFMLDEGIILDYPFAIDVETQSRFDRKATTTYVKQWCEAVESYAYFAMIYASDISGFSGILNSSELEEYSFWVARYSSTKHPTHQYGIWQYTNKLHLPGIAGYCDGDYAAYDFAAVIESKHLNRKKEVVNYE